MLGTPRNLPLSELQKKPATTLIFMTLQSAVVVV